MLENIMLKIKKNKSLYRPALFEHSQNSLKGMFL